MMVVLVDYGNVEAAIRSRGVEYLIQRMLYALGSDRLAIAGSIRFRLYGGWYEESVPTRLAQSLATKVLELYPCVSTVMDGTAKVAIKTEVELAYSVCSDPSRHLFHTYREKGYAHDIRCLHPSTFCSRPNCPLVVIHDFIENHKCPNAECQTDPTRVLYRSQQKLVDTMLTSDLIHLAATGRDEICVVSSDDDIWPGVLSALKLGAKVTHIQAKTGRSANKLYCHGIGPNYEECTI